MEKRLEILCKTEYYRLGSVLRCLQETPSLQVSTLQRKARLGYSRALNLLDTLVEAGILQLVPMGLREDGSGFVSRPTYDVAVTPEQLEMLIQALPPELDWQSFSGSP